MTKEGLSRETRDQRETTFKYHKNKKDDDETETDMTYEVKLMFVMTMTFMRERSNPFPDTSYKDTVITMTVSISS